ncbi:hypothetical protein BD309DRAFT_546457 [Dichomitus squalens]|nr:hypothetical protein BD309DRAFT_546457 [Dichomitus squalens]
MFPGRRAQVMLGILPCKALQVPETSRNAGDAGDAQQALLPTIIGHTTLDIHFYRDLPAVLQGVLRAYRRMRYVPHTMVARLRLIDGRAARSPMWLNLVSRLQTSQQHSVGGRRGA